MHSYESVNKSLGSFDLDFWKGVLFFLEPFPNPSLLAAMNSNVCLLFLVRLLLSAWSLFFSTWFEKNALKQKAGVHMWSPLLSLLSTFVAVHLLLSNVCKWLFYIFPAFIIVHGGRINPVTSQCNINRKAVGEKTLFTSWSPLKVIFNRKKRLAGPCEIVKLHIFLPIVDEIEVLRRNLY